MGAVADCYRHQWDDQHIASTTLLVNLAPPRQSDSRRRATSSRLVVAGLGRRNRLPREAGERKPWPVPDACLSLVDQLLDTGLTDGITYFYVVSAAFTGNPNAGGESANSGEVNATPSSGGTNGALTGSGVASFAAVDLTATGTGDWAKWPNYIHKASGGAQIPNFTQIGAAAPQIYTNDTRPISWSDGTPTATGTNDISGNSITGIGNGFQFSVPADTATRTLYVYVGGWISAGKLVAHLSDGSAPDYVNTSFSSSNGQYRAVYTLTYRAASAGRQLVVQWTQISGTGNVKLQAVALAGPPAPAIVSASDGTSATNVTVSWSASSGATSYTVYRSASAGTLGASIGTTNNLSFTDTTVAPGTLYYYAVVATGAGGNSTPSAQDSGYAGIPGSLVGLGVASFAAVDLTATGTGDWAKWPNYIHKASGGAQIPNFTQIGAAAPQTYNNDTRPISWSDGTPTATGTNDISGNSITGIANGFQFSVPADTATRTLYVYVGGWISAGKLVAHLSDGSAPDYVDASFSSSNAQYRLVYTLTYSAASAGQHLVVQWTQTSGTGNVKLQAVALAGPPAPATVSASDGTSATSVTVSWSSSAGATNYTVYRSASAGTLGSSIGTTNNLSFTDTTVVVGTRYYYAVVATGAGGSSAPSAQDSGFAGVPSALTGSGVASFAAVDLTATGTGDWAKWPNYIHKASGGGQIPNFTQIGTAAPQIYTNDTRPISWSDGTPTATGTNDISGNSITGIGNGFQFSVPADTATRTLYVYVGGWTSAGKLVAHLSDGSAPDYVNTSFSSSNAQYRAVYTLTYRAASAGRQLVVQWTQTSGAGNVKLQAVALAGPPGTRQRLGE